MGTTIKVYAILMFESARRFPPHYQPSTSIYCWRSHAFVLHDLATTWTLAVGSPIIGSVEVNLRMPIALRTSPKAYFGRLYVLVLKYLLLIEFEALR